MPQIKRQFPGKKAEEIYERVDQIMEHLTTKMGLKYDKDPHKKGGKVTKLGISGSYLARDGEVTIDLNFPMLVPGSLKRQVQEDIERKLDKLFA